MRVRVRRCCQIAPLGALLFACSSGVDGLRVTTDSQRPAQPAPSAEGDAGDEADAPDVSDVSDASDGVPALVTDAGTSSEGHAGVTPVAPPNLPSGSFAARPRRPSSVPLAPAESGHLDGIGAAVWSREQRLFFALEAGAGRLFTIDPSTRPEATVGGPYSIDAPGPFAASALAITSSSEATESLFVVAGDSLLRVQTSGDVEASWSLPVLPGSTPEWTLAHAGGWLLATNEDGPAAALEDGAGDLTVIDELMDARHAATDGSRFLVSRRAYPPRVELHVIEPGAFAWHAAPCSVQSFSHMNAALTGDRVAWVVRTEVDYRLEFADVTEAACEASSPQWFGEFNWGIEAVGLIDPDRALVVEQYRPGVPGYVSFGIRDRKTGTRVRTLENVPVYGEGVASQSIVMGGDAYAILVTGGRPVLITL